MNDTAPVMLSRLSRDQREPTAADPHAPAFSIIVPMHRDTPDFRWCIEQCLALDYPNFEVVVVSDQEIDLGVGVTTIATNALGDSGPGVKRDVGMRAARGDYLAFIDDDAAPSYDWLQRALAVFNTDPKVGAVAGPGVTPPRSSFRERVGGAFYESFLGSGPYRYRFRPERTQDVDDYPAYNFIVRRSAAEQVQGWGTDFYGGEDTVICLALIQNGWRIVYDPTVVVYHKRRPVLARHLAQVGNVGRHRGYFVKAYPKTSLRPSYFLPAAGTLALMLLIIGSTIQAAPRLILGAAACAYLITSLALSIWDRNPVRVTVLLPVVTLISHVTYGVQFLRGLLQPKLAR